MTLQPQQEFSIPEETARVARAAYPKGNVYMKMRDALGPMYQDESFAHVFPQNGRASRSTVAARVHHGGAVLGGTSRSTSCGCGARADRVSCMPSA